MGIPVVGIVDTNSDPDMIKHVIPANDDAPRSIQILMDYMAEAIRRGQEVAATKPKEQLTFAETFESGIEGMVFEPEEEDESL